MSYYTSKYPGFLLYMALVIATVGTFLYTQSTPLSIGILSTLWGAYILLRTLTLYEISEYSAPLKQHRTSKYNNESAAKLPLDLKTRLGSNENLKRGLQSLCAVKLRSIIWLSLGLLYAISYLYWNKQSLNAIEAVQNASTLFMIGGAFWAGQSYASSTKTAHIMMITFTFLLILSVANTTSFSAQSLYAYLPDLLGNNSALALAILSTYSCIMLFYSLKQNINNTGHALTGLSIIGFLALTYLSHEVTTNMNALWISGWALFSIFWVRTYKRGHKSYVLYQCQ